MKQTVAVILLMCIITPVALYTFDASTAGMLWDFSPKEVAWASGIRTTPYGNNFLQHYFYNLRSNFGRNELGTCGYIAAGMLLAYFDTYWDDEIVPERYETLSNISSLDDYDYNSPGAGEIPHTISNCGYSGTSQTELFNHILNDHKSDVLHGALLDCMLRTYNQLNFQVAPDGNLYYVSIDPYQAEIIVNEFLDLYSSSSTIYTSVSYEDLLFETDDTHINEVSANARERIVSSVTRNIPVAVYLGSTADYFDRHVAIAYDYDPINDMLYFHNGWQGRDYYISEVSLGLKSSGNSGATRYYYGDLTFFLLDEHVHSYNFILDSGVSVCSCQLSDHQHVLSYELYSGLQHKITCHCSYYSFGNHLYILNGTRYVCKDCGLIYMGSKPPIIPVDPKLLSYDSEAWFGVDIANCGGWICE